MHLTPEDIIRTHQWIDSDDLLRELLTQLQGADWLAVDTEFVRTDTFYPVPGIVQLYDGRQVYLVDALKIDDWSPLNTIFSNPKILKVLHACGEDLELFYSLDIQQPQPLFDTQVAAALLGGDLNEGLQSLVSGHLGLVLDKHQTRSDWTLRPLSDEQIHYAKEDVIVLLPLYQRLKAELEAAQKYDLALAEGELVARNAAAPVSSERYYLKVRGAWKLRRHAQELLADLATWREKEAKLRNVPRRRIIADDDLIQVAQTRPENQAKLVRCTSMRAGQLRKFGDEILDIVQSHNVDREDNPEFVMIRPPLPKSTKELYQNTRDKAQSVASDLGVHPGLLASRSMLEELVHWFIKGKEGGKPSLLQSWRGEMVGRQLLELMESYPAQGSPIDE